MKDKTLMGGILVMAAGALLIGAAWFIFLRPSITPTGPIQAIPVNITGSPEEYTIFAIVPEKSEVTFTLNEVLRGLPTTVVGRSQLVAGQVAVNFESPPASQLGPILINARTLLTDNVYRNNAIQNFILEAETYEYITFTPTQINGWPEMIVSNEPVSLQITGNLTIRDITSAVTFATTVMANDSTELAGSATAEIERADFNLVIPNAPGVADVSDSVTLTINFFAEPLDMVK